MPQRLPFRCMRPLLLSRFEGRTVLLACQSSEDVADPLAREQVKLYGLPQAEFTAARNARAKELRKNDPELAATVAALPKPTAAAAALNELVREDPSEARALIQSGKRLRQAQEAAVAGKRGADLQKAIEEHRTALDRMQRDLRRRKLTAATVDKAAKTLRVVSVDPDLQPLLERGTLHEDLTAAGFGLDPGIVPAKRESAEREAPDRAVQDKRRSEARERLKAARAALTEAKRTARKAEAEQREAERRAETARREVERATKEMEDAQETAAEA
jgi:hypothetical protein